MNEALLKQIDQEIENVREVLARDTIHLIGVRSVKGEPEPGAPFGPGPRAMLDAVIKLGEREGFFPTRYTDSVISIAPQEGEPDLGIWLHGDVVHEGIGWNFDPYQATEYKGCIVGRGATDNKGQLCAIFHLLNIFKKLNIPLNYKIALFVGSNEESGKNDLKDFLTKFSPPRLSLVPDASFPVGYGGKGGLNLALRAKKPLQGITITAGQVEAPFKAVAEAFGRTIVTNSMPRHLSSPDPNGNMITLMAAICDADGNADFAKPHMPMLEQWVKYLIEFGEDPGHQLCTDDFAGHLAHNVNLSIKAIMGIAGYSRILKRLGKSEEADELMQTAKRYAASVCARSVNPDGSYRLAFDMPHTFSLKYNAVWDKLWNTNLFPAEFYEGELKRYRDEAVAYGIPLDSRECYTKSDWIHWISCMGSKEDFVTFNQLLWNAYDHTDRGIPMTDWYYANTSLYRGFKHRTVQGGLWMKFLFL